MGQMVRRSKNKRSSRVWRQNGFSTGRKEDGDNTDK